jgi:hypothetical protein
VTFAYRAGLAALACFFFALPARAADVSSVEQARFIGAFGTIRGTGLVGVGSRSPYLGVVLEGDLQLTVMMKKWIGLDLDLRFGDGGVKTGSGDKYYGRIDAAAVTPLVRRDGPRGYSLLAGVGLGMTAGDRFWWADVRGYPYALLRFTYLFTRNVSTYAQARVSPIDTSLAAHTWAVESQFEAGIGVGLFFAGARVGLSAIEGGDPDRTYGDLEMGFYLGIGARYKPGRRL